MSSSKLQRLKHTLKMGARANKYRVMIAAPVGPVNEDVLIDTLVKSSSAPGKTIGTIEVNTQGRKLVLPGETQFDGTWSCTFYLTEDHRLRNLFDKWMNFIDDANTNSRKSCDPKEFMSNSAKIQQLRTCDGTVSAEYEFSDLFPTSISSIEYADDSNDTILEFTVEFAYSTWKRTDEPSAQDLSTDQGYL